MSNTNPTSQKASSLIIAASDKAGMKGINRPLIDSIILRESSNSDFMTAQLKRDAAVDERIRSMKRRLVEMDHHNDGDNGNDDGKRHERRERTEQSLEPDLHRMQMRRRKTSTCVVVDMDAFYIECELLSRPDLRSVPACVGKSLITTSNYPARRYGVRSAMAGWIGDKLVEELSGGKEKLVHLDSNFGLYREKSEVVREVLREYDPNMKSYSLDEVYFDLGRYLEMMLIRHWDHERIVRELKVWSGNGNQNTKQEENEKTNTDNSNVSPPTQQTISPLDNLATLPQQTLINATNTLLHNIRNRVRTATHGLTCSAGIASNFLLAKIASDVNKPNGQLLIGPSEDEIRHFIDPLPARKVPGIGRVTGKILAAFGIETVRDLYTERALVKELWPPKSAGFLLRASIGYADAEDPNVTTVDDKDSAGGSGDGDSFQKGISKERTFRSGGSWAEINAKLEEIAWNLSRDMKKKDLFARTVTLKVKLHTFDVLSRSKSVAKGFYLQNAQDIVTLVAKLLADLKKEYHESGGGGKKNFFSVRLLGIRCSNFRGEEDKREERRQPGIESFLKGTGEGRKKWEEKRSGNCANRVDGAEDSLPIIDSKNGDGLTHRVGDRKGRKSYGIESFLIKKDQQHSVTKAIDTNEDGSTIKDLKRIFEAQKEDNICDGDNTEAQDKAITSCVTQYCPVCSITLPNTDDNDSLNRHIDSCLMRTNGSCRKNCVSVVSSTSNEVTSVYDRANADVNDDARAVPLSSVPPVKTSDEILSVCRDVKETDQQIWNCPICSALLPVTDDNDGLNRHIDSCLNNSAVRKLAQRESVAADVRLRKKTKSLAYFFT